MTGRVKAAIVSLIAALACVAAAAGPAGAAQIGIGDGIPSTYSDPRFLAMHITTARDVIPWDIVTRPQDSGDLVHFITWLGAVERAGVTPLVSFGADYTNPAANHVPSTAEYSTAVTAFLARFPGIKTYTAWNEPDFSYRSLARKPKLAASYFNTLASICHGCTVLAGDVYLPATGPRRIDHALATLRPWLKQYIKGIHHKPSGWALHDYTEVRARNMSQIKILASMTRGPIWLDETGGVLRRGHWKYRNQSAKAASRDEKYLLNKIAKRYRRVKRIYHYQWRANPSVGWDSGLIAPNGRTRPSYGVLLKYIQKHH